MVDTQAVFGDTVPHESQRLNFRLQLRSVQLHAFLSASQQEQIQVSIMFLSVPAMDHYIIGNAEDSRQSLPSLIVAGEPGKRHALRAHIPEAATDWLNPLSLGTMSASVYIENLA